MEILLEGGAVRFRAMPRGPFDLAHQNQHFGGWPTLSGDPGTIVMAFPVDGAWGASAAVTVRQEPSGAVHGEVHGTRDPSVAEMAAHQAVSALSLDVDGTEWPRVGERDPVMGALQQRHGWLRPVLFHSGYEAAASFLLGHRLRITQARQVRKDLAARHGKMIMVGSQAFYAFPEPATLAGLTQFPGVAAEKWARLRVMSEATLQGQLDRARLRLGPADEVIADVQALPGVGPVFAQGIVIRGAGRSDEITDDDITRHAVTQQYHLDHPAGRPDVGAVARAWCPFRTWAIVLLHVEARGSGGPQPRRSRPRRP